MLRKCSRRSRDLFRDVFVHLELLSTSDFEVMYSDLLHYGFITWRRKYSHIILEHVTTTCIMMSSDIHGRIDAPSLKNTTVTANGEKNKWSSMSPSNVTWPFNTSQLSQRLAYILNKCHYKNQHTYTSNSLLIYILELVLYKRIKIIVVMGVFYHNLFK